MYPMYAMTNATPQTGYHAVKTTHRGTINENRVHTHQWAFGNELSLRPLAKKRSGVRCDP